jgi:hypothetical protein
MPVKISPEHSEEPIMLSVFLPGADQHDPRWMVWRHFTGVWLEDLTVGESYGPGTMAEALNGVDTIIMNEVAHAAAKLPEELIPTLKR